MAVATTLFVARGMERRLISLKNIHSVLERNEMEAWQKLIRVLTHEIMNSITPIISLSETLSERGVPVTLKDAAGEKEYAVMLQAMYTIHRRSKGLLGFVENYRRLTRLPAPVCASVPVRDNKNCRFGYRTQSLQTDYESAWRKYYRLFGTGKRKLFYFTILLDKYCSSKRLFCVY